jgi:uncharacterized membrane protein YeaQ/YmgE (transglycosylase-associated protein family)
MINILVWTVYGIFVGSIAKSIVPGEENFGFLKTVALGVAGSYMGGAIAYMLGQYSTLEPAGIFLGVLGSALTIVLYNKLYNK